MLLGYALADWGQTTVTPGKKGIYKRETFPFYFISMETVTTSRARNHFLFFFWVWPLYSVLLLLLTPASKIWIFKKALITAHISSAEISNFLKILSLLSRLQPKAEHLPCKYHLGYASFLYFNNDSWCGVQSLQMRKSNK